jgi:hypothetical protein
MPSNNETMVAAFARLIIKYAAPEDVQTIAAFAAARLRLDDKRLLPYLTAYYNALKHLPFVAVYTRNLTPSQKEWFEDALARRVKNLL